LGLEISPAQCRAARALLNWSQGQLETASQVAKKTIADFEREARRPYPRTISAIRAALESAGIEFTDGDAPGVRLLGPAAKALKERQAVRQREIEESGIPEIEFKSRD